MNNRVAVVPAITYSNNKNWGARRKGGGWVTGGLWECVRGAVVEIVPKGNGSRQRERK